MTIEFVIEVDWSEAGIGQTPMAKQPDSIEAFLKMTLLHAKRGSGLLCENIAGVEIGHKTALRGALCAIGGAKICFPRDHHAPFKVSVGYMDDREQCTVFPTMLFDVIT
jgi:hypothetical protein